ncbi:MAG: hypothetical protein MHM6MM_003618 [Cercozoa sp. M6MM]
MERIESEFDELAPRVLSSQRPESRAPATLALLLHAIFRAEGSANAEFEDNSNATSENFAFRDGMRSLRFLVPVKVDDAQSGRFSVTVRCVSVGQQLMLHATFELPGSESHGATAEVTSLNLSLEEVRSDAREISFEEVLRRPRELAESLQQRFVQRVVTKARESMTQEPRGPARVETGGVGAVRPPGILPEQRQPRVPGGDFGDDLMPPFPTLEPPRRDGSGNLMGPDHPRFRHPEQGEPRGMRPPGVRFDPVSPFSNFGEPDPDAVLPEQLGPPGTLDPLSRQHIGGNRRTGRRGARDNFGFGGRRGGFGGDFGGGFM